MLQYIVIIYNVLFLLINMFTFLGGSYFQKIISFAEFGKKTQELIINATKDLDHVVDNHAHLCGLGQNDTFYINNCFHNKYDFLKYIHLKIFENAAGIICANSSDEEKNKQYIAKLKLLIDDCNNYVNYKMTLLPMDHYYENSGEKNKNKTGFYCSTEAVYEAANKYNNFIPIISIHPAREDAISELEKWHDRGATMIKWLPNSMNIDCSNSQYENFYKKVIELNMKILVHVGHEHSVDAGYLNQELGNPLRLRYPLNLGVKIVAAHCATEGMSIDLDITDTKITSHKVENFKLFSRLMNDPKYEKTLYADISACIGFKRIKYLNELLDNKHWHSRLLFGSDYPVPCIPFVTSTKLLYWYGLISLDKIKPLNEIFYSNPILYNLVLFRTITSKNGNKFDKSIFERSFINI